MHLEINDFGNKWENKFISFVDKPIFIIPFLEFIFLYILSAITIGFLPFFNLDFLLACKSKSVSILGKLKAIAYTLYCFNSKLIEYDYDKIDYVIVHELSHIIHFNHSKNFWELVGKYCKDYKKIRRELKE